MECQCVVCLRIDVKQARDLALHYLRTYNTPWIEMFGKPRVFYVDHRAYFGPKGRISHWEPYNTPMSPRSNAIAWVRAARGTTPGVFPGSRPETWTPQKHSFLCATSFCKRMETVVTTLHVLGLGHHAEGLVQACLFEEHQYETLASFSSSSSECDSEDDESV